MENNELNALGEFYGSLGLAYMTLKHSRTSNLLESSYTIVKLNYKRCTGINEEQRKAVLGSLNTLEKELNVEITR